MRPRVTLLGAYILANALLYSTLIPLWGGFDEPFHFGYVQQLANGQGVPDPRSSVLSREVGASIPIAPASRPVQLNLPQVRTYSEYFTLSREQRIALRAQLDALPEDWRWERSNFVNYEGQQTPLAFLLFAAPERALAGIPLPDRVLALRIIVALAGSLLLYFGAAKLFGELGLDGAYGHAAMFCVFSCQMTWAIMAHVANDWLAVPLATWSLVANIRYWRNPSLRTAAWAAVVLSLGLLAKAYFLAFVPIPFLLCVAKKRFRDLSLISAVVLIVAGPWYARNMLRYGSLTATIQSRAGVGAVSALHATPGLNWPRIVWASVRAAFWTGNNTFEAFSVTTVTVVVLVWLIALVLWGRSKHGNAEWIAALHCGLFIAALIYDAAIESVYAHRSVGAAPWYSQVLLAPMLGLAFLGCFRWGRFRSHRAGGAVASALTGLFGYVLIATYLLKLIPLYGGYEGRASVGSLIALYSGRLPSLMDNLNLIALAPAGVLFGLTAAVVVLAITEMTVLIRSIN